MVIIEFAKNMLNTFRYNGLDTDKKTAMIDALVKDIAEYSNKTGKADYFIKDKEEYSDEFINASEIEHMIRDGIFGTYIQYHLKQEEEKAIKNNIFKSLGLGKEDIIEKDNPLAKISHNLYQKAKKSIYKAYEEVAIADKDKLITKAVIEMSQKLRNELKQYSSVSSYVGQLTQLAKEVGKSKTVGDLKGNIQYANDLFKTVEGTFIDEKARKLFTKTLENHKSVKGKSLSRASVLNAKADKLYNEFKISFYPERKDEDPLYWLRNEELPTLQPTLQCEQEIITRIRGKRELQQHKEEQYKREYKEELILGLLFTEINKNLHSDPTEPFSNILFGNDVELANALYDTLYGNLGGLFKQAKKIKAEKELTDALKTAFLKNIMVKNGNLDLDKFSKEMSNRYIILDRNPLVHKIFPKDEIKKMIEAADKYYDYKKHLKTKYSHYATWRLTNNGRLYKELVKVYNKIRKE